MVVKLHPFLNYSETFYLCGNCLVKLTKVYFIRHDYMIPLPTKLTKYFAQQQKKRLKKSLTLLYFKSSREIILGPSGTPMLTVEFFGSFGQKQLSPYGWSWESVD